MLEMVQLVKIGHRERREPCILTLVEGIAAVQVHHTVSACQLTSTHQRAQKQSQRVQLHTHERKIWALYERLIQWICVCGDRNRGVQEKLGEQVCEMTQEMAQETLRNQQEQGGAVGSDIGRRCMGSLLPVVPLLMEWPFPFPVFSYVIGFGYLRVINTALFLTFLISH